MFWRNRLIEPLQAAQKQQMKMAIFSVKIDTKIHISITLPVSTSKFQSENEKNM
jgi:hypothetical protein